MLPKKGRIFRNGSGDNAPRIVYAREIREALKKEFARNKNASKTIRKWTGAGERTVKNWFDGASGPRGEHLLLLACHSDQVFETILFLTEREARSQNSELREHCEAIVALLKRRRENDRL
jgi:hypothetical protein